MTKIQIPVVEIEEMQLPHMTATESSNIGSMGFDIPNKTLYVDFKQSGIYRYVGVPGDVFEELKTSESIGKAFVRLVRTNSEYSCEKVQLKESDSPDSL